MRKTLIAFTIAMAVTVGCVAPAMAQAMAKHEIALFETGRQKSYHGSR